MLFKSLAVAAAVSGVAVAQTPANSTVCDYYTTALLTNNTAENQATVLTLIVNTAIIGNYTPELNKGVNVPGILAPGKVNDTDVNLAPYFTGQLASTNTGGTVGQSVNFLDDGGAAPLKLNKPANGTTSRQYTLVTHLYSYFGTLLGCSHQADTAYGAYTGSNSMYEVHKFMDLSYAEVTYFVNQVGLSAKSFGVGDEDVKAVGGALMGLFGYSCAAEAVVIPTQPAALQSICIDSTCPVAANATCDKYQTQTKPVNATSTSDPSGTATPNSTTSPSASPSNGAVAVGVNFALVAAGFAAALL